MQHKFVEFIPAEIEENLLYISLEYDVAKHKCACGCGADIVTSISPARWKLTYDGETVSLSPSIGNWSHPCKSHYFITNNQVVWSGSFSEDAIRNVIKNDREDLKRHVVYGRKGNRFLNFIRNFFK
ncbi:DUF6527 family protein [Rossellomorea oryzaecorticis]|uniref:DUF6527 family protein n=1 Tax=Rossellomorea oryzaecorticis TaxID=1396505 RepID=A0ABU9K7T0_9BACI